MNRLYIFITVLIILGLNSCNNVEFENASKLRVLKQDNYIVTSIQQGSQGEIFCVGQIRNSDSTVVLRYDRALNLIERTELSEFPDFKGRLNVTYIEDGWLISSLETEDGYSTLYVMTTDEKFNIRKKIMAHRRFVGTIFNYQSGFVHELKLLQNGDFLMVWDTSRITLWAGSANTASHASYDFGIRLTRFSPDLETLSAFKFGKEGINLDDWYPLNPRAVELGNGDIFYAFLVYTEDARAVAYGLMDAQGRIKYQKLDDSPDAYITPVGLSRIGDKVIYNQSLSGYQFYTLLDPNTGEEIKEINLEAKYSNYWRMGSNPLPQHLNNSGGGHFVLSETNNSMDYLSADMVLNITHEFSLSLPELPVYESVRQLITEEGTIIVGCNIESKGSSDFVLQELSRDGEVLR